jgi:hypothetical protein
LARVSSAWRCKGQGRPTWGLPASKGSVGPMVGLVPLLLAPVLGLLVFTAFSVFI